MKQLWYCAKNFMDLQIINYLNMDYLSLKIKVVIIH